RRSHANPTLLNDFEMAAEGNGDPPVPDLRTIEELCQPSLNGRGGPIALIVIQESDKIERYVGGVPDVIHKSVVASRPKTMQKAIEMANELMGKMNNTWAECQAENKRKLNDTSRNNQSQQQQQNKRQNTGRAYNERSGEKKPYDPCAPKCHKCNC
nr:hypothetical protein [Tanacetum cinerariifolium]